MAFYASDRNCIDIVSGNTPHYIRHKTEVNIKMHPCGCGVRFLPDEALREKSHSLDGKMSLGILVGIPLLTDGRYSGDLLIVDIEELPTAVSDRGVYAHRVKTEEVAPPKS